MVGRAAAGLALLGLLASLSLAAPALAAPAWVAPQDLSLPGRNAEEPQAAIDPAGNAVAVWARSNGTHTIIQSASRPTGGSWTSAVSLSAAGRNAERPQVGVDAAGNAVAVWMRTNGAHTIIQSASRALGGQWTAGMDLSAAGRDAKEPRLAIDPAGNAVAVWARFDGFDDIVQAAVRTPGGAWLPPDDLSAGGENAKEPQVAIDPAGNAVAVWSRFDGSHFIAQAAARAPGGAWAPAADISEEGESATEPDLALTPSGSAIAVWSRDEGADQIVQSAVRPPGGAWGNPMDASPAGRRSTEPQVAVDPAGNAAAVWKRSDIGPYTIVQAASMAAGGGWSGAQDLTGFGESVETPQVAIDPGGNAVALWGRSSGAPTVIEGRIRPAGGGWGPPVNVSSIGRTATEPDLALDPAGDGVAVWSREDGVNTIAQAAGFDGAGPLMLGLSVPPAATVRQLIAFSVTPFDVWSPISAIAWSFGDGGGAHGPAVTHSFERPGVYPVSVTALDQHGNGAGAAGVVTVYRKPAAGKNIRVRRGRALLRLRCPSPAGCSGMLRLVAPVEIKRKRRSTGKRRLIRKRRQIGRKAFSIPGARTSTVRVRLTKKGRVAVHRAGRRGLRTQLTGPGVRHRLVILYGVRFLRRRQR